jgi:bleomycin hydrolase
MMKRVYFILFLFVACLPAIGQRLTRNELGLFMPDKVACTPVKDQFMSSTCWSFASTSLLESELLRSGKGQEDISEMFVARYSMLRKIERHLAMKGGNFFTPGGQFHDVVWVMKNYGMVPEVIYNGKGRGEKSHDHSEMDTLLSHFVQYCIKRGITGLNTAQRHFIDSTLDHYYGKIPLQFMYNGRPYTPKTYLSGYLGLHPDDYVEITSYTHHPFYTSFVLEDKYNWTGDAYYNVPIEDFQAITDMALENGYSVGWDGDAEDDYFDYAEGLAYMPEPVSKFQEARQQAFEDQSTLLNHMMHITGKTRKMGATWYYIKNSWGSTSNKLGGYLYMREDYFKLRTLAIIVNKKAIPAAILKKMKLRG